MKLMCTGCQGWLQVADEFVNQRMKCPLCNSVFTVPAKPNKSEVSPSSPTPPPRPPVSQTALTEPAEWHYAQSNQKCGPVSWNHLKSMAATGQLRPDDLVWKKGMASWAAPSAIVGLFPDQPPPPPLPKGGDDTESGYLAAVSHLLHIWPKLKGWEKVTWLTFLVVILTAIVWAKLLQPATSDGQKSWLEIVLNSSFVYGVVGSVFRLLGQKSRGEADQGIESGTAGNCTVSGKQFVGLDARQWFLTLHIAFVSLLMGAIVAALLFGAVSLWVNGFALAVVGVLITMLALLVFPNVNQVPEIGLSVGLGISAVITAALALLCGCNVFTEKHVVWVYVVYGVLAGLPSIHVIQWLSQRTPPIRNSAGALISGGYLVAVVLACIVISANLNRPNHPREYAASDELRTMILGTWEEVDEEDSFSRDRGRTKGKCRIEFTKGGQALVSNWTVRVCLIRDHAALRYWNSGSVFLGWRRLSMR